MIVYLVESINCRILSTPGSLCLKNCSPFCLRYRCADTTKAQPTYSKPVNGGHAKFWNLAEQFPLTHVRPHNKCLNCWDINCTEAFAIFYFGGSANLFYLEWYITICLWASFGNTNMALVVTCSWRSWIGGNKQKYFRIMFTWKHFQIKIMWLVNVVLSLPPSISVME